jgi:hypothetical protein
MKTTFQKTPDKEKLLADSGACESTSTLRLTLQVSITGTPDGVESARAQLRGLLPLIIRQTVCFAGSSQYLAIRSLSDGLTTFTALMFRWPWGR